MRSPTQKNSSPHSSFTSVQSGLLQRKCGCGESATLTGHCSECESHQLTLQKKATDQAESFEVPAIVHEVLHSPGQPLDFSTRVVMETHLPTTVDQIPPSSSVQPKLSIGSSQDYYEQEADKLTDSFIQNQQYWSTNPKTSNHAQNRGHDFSKVRIHSGAEAAESARSLNALAYTVGQDIVFGVGQYAPQTFEGQKLLVHELTHVIQQSNNGEVLQRKPKQKKIWEIDNPKLSLYQAHPIAGKFFKGLAQKKASEIKAINFDLNPDCPTRASYGAIPYNTGADIIEAIAKAYWCTGDQVREIHIFGHSGPSGIYGTVSVAERGLYSTPRSQENQEKGGRAVSDIPTEALAKAAVFVLHGCSTAYDDDSFAEVLLKSLLGTSPKAKVYGHSEGGTCGRDSDWKEFSKKYPEGKKRSTNPYHTSDEL